MIVQKGNRQLRVSSEEKQKFLADGYDVLDEKGKVVEMAEQKTYSAAEVAGIRDKYEAEIAKLKKTLKKESQE